MPTGSGQRKGRWTVGDLAAATGLSIRVLRHWDELGVVPASRTAGGHRCYTESEVTRLYRALALRQMGLRLDEVKALLASADLSPRATLAAHLERVDTQLAVGQALRARLVEALNSLDRDSPNPADDVSVDTEQLMKVIEKMTMFDQHLTVEQQEWFARRRQQMGEHTWQRSLDAWPELVDAVRAEMDAGTDPADPRVQELMTRWAKLQQVFLDDEPEMRSAAGRAWQAMWDQHPDQLRRSPRLAPPEMWNYIHHARDTGRTS